MEASLDDRIYDWLKQENVWADTRTITRGVADDADPNLVADALLKLVGDGRVWFEIFDSEIRYTARAEAV